MQKELIMKALRKAINSPCSICGAAADEVVIFYPEGPEKFNMTERQAMYFPICQDCLNKKLDRFFCRIPEECFVVRSGK